MYRAPLAALMLALQGLSGGLVSLVHAAERTSAPAAIETRHSAQCPVLHDAFQCPQCHQAGPQAPVQHVRTGLADRDLGHPAPPDRGARPGGADRSPGAPPRAPPIASR